MRFKEAAPISFIGASSVCEPSMDPRVTNRLYLRVRQRFFGQVGHETMYESRRNKHFFIKSCYHQTYQNYEQSQQKLGTILGNRVS